MPSSLAPRCCAEGFLAGAYHELQQHGVNLSVYYPGSPLGHKSKECCFLLFGGGVGVHWDDFYHDELSLPYQQAG